MTELLENYENEDYYRQSRRRNDGPEPRTYQNNNQGTNNTNTGYQGGRAYPQNNSFNNNNNVNNSNYNNNNNTGPNHVNPSRPSNGYQGNRNPYPHNTNSQRSPNYGNDRYHNNNNRAGPNNSNPVNNRFPRPRVNFIRATDDRQRRYNNNQRNSYRGYEDRRRSLEPVSYTHLLINSYKILKILINLLSSWL